MVQVHVDESIRDFGHYLATTKFSMTTVAFCPTGYQYEICTFVVLEAFLEVVDLD